MRRSFRRSPFVGTPRVVLACTAALLLFLAPDAHGLAGGTQRWATSQNGAGVAFAIATSPDGSMVFVTGAGAPDSAEPVTTAAYSASSGAVRWVARCSCGGESIAVSPDGSTVFVTGASWGVTNGYANFATAAYAASTGAPIWVKDYRDAARAGDLATSLALSPDGSMLFVTGTSGQRRYVTVAYRADSGGRRWVRHYVIGAHAFLLAEFPPPSIAVNPDGSRLYVTGTGPTRSGSFGYLTLAYQSASGDLAWARHYTRGNWAWVTSVAVSPDGAAVFITGSTQVRSRNQDSDYATIAYEASTGARLWVRLYNGPGNDYDVANAIAVSSDNSTVVVTGLSSTAPQSYVDYATVAYDASTGSKRWVRRYDAGGLNDRAYALALSSDGSVAFVTGESYAPVPDSGFAADDYATVAYEVSTGSQLWVARTGDQPSIMHVADAITVSPAGSRVFVTGTAAAEFLTVAYES